MATSRRGKRMREEGKMAGVCLEERLEVRRYK